MTISNSKEILKFIHVFDDDKFIDPAIKLFESVAPNMSKYFVIAIKNKPFKYVKSKNVTPLYLEDEEESFLKFINQSNPRAVFFHALNESKQEIVNKLDHRIIKVWFIWGFDLYGNWKLLKKHIYEKETLSFLGIGNWKSWMKNKILFNSFAFHFFFKFRNAKYLFPKKLKIIIDNNYFTKFYRAAEKIDIVVPVIPNEFDLIKKMKINPTYAPFTYGCIEDMLCDNIDNNVLKAKNILVGNSGNPSNNHLDVFIGLSKLNLGKRKIIVPLSYSGTKEYVDFVIKKGRFFFGENFEPLINFMPLKDYTKLISSCGFVILNHIRQQAVGNIIVMGYLGAKIFLNKKSPVYKYYEEQGIVVYNTNMINQNNLEENISIIDFKSNKNIYLKLYSREAVKIKIENLFKIVNLKFEQKLIES